MAHASTLPPAVEARRLLRGLDRATLATDLEGWPYASLVIVATAPDGAPLLLLSDLAQHTLNLKQEPRASLLFDGTAGLDEPLTGARVTMLGRAGRVDDKDLLRRFCARHPSAAAYAGFADFHLYRLELERAHIVAGFGRIHWLSRDDLVIAPDALGALGAAESDIVQHMNDDHAEAVDLYANRLLGLAGTGWRMTGMDIEGADLRCGGRVARLPFDSPVRDPQAARAAFVRLAKEARAATTP
jgi:putative heme iron utilization protein